LLRIAAGEFVVVVFHVAHAALPLEKDASQCKLLQRGVSLKDGFLRLGEAGIETGVLKM
jgi:hypothetical protein